MVIEGTYKLCGYIDYIPSSVGFVTPVFKDQENMYCIQVSAERKRRLEWELLPLEYHSSVFLTDQRREFKLGDSFLYGFKWEDALFFAEGKDMADFLSKSVLPTAKEGHELVKEFIADWISLEPVSQEITKESIWKNCLDFIGNYSRTMPGIFFENFEVVEFNSGILTLKSRNESVKKVFVSKFEEQLILFFRKEIPNFQITIIQDDNILPALPFVYFGGGEPLISQGSFIIETSIKPFQDFDNFIVSAFNSNAYHRALDFIENKSASILTIRGAAGVGKTHLLNSIAKHLTKSVSDKKVGVYTVFSQSDSKNEISESEIEQFETSASDNDIIIIDDAHNINDKKLTLQRLIRVFKKWRGMDKSIVLSFRDSFQVDLLPEFLEDTQQLVFTLPDEVDKLKIIESKINSYNIRLTGRDILMLSEDRQIQSITDIQRYLTRVYLTEDFKTISRNIFLSHHYSDYFNIKWVESSVYDYFRLNQEHSYFVLPEIATVNAKIISRFIKDLFIVPHHGSVIAKETEYVDGVFYSFDTLQYYLFESKPFKKVVSEILRELILKGDAE